VENIDQIRECVIVPTYNNEHTLLWVIERIVRHVDECHIVVIDDGSTYDTASVLVHYCGRITLLVNDKNYGKGYALRRGFRWAIDRGYRHAITIDADGQHDPDDLPTMIAASMDHPNSVIMGSRNMDQSDVPSKSSLGNKFSNFWFWIETGIRLPDTQTGFRVYPLQHLKKMRLFSSKFELEIEVIVRLAWKKVSFHAVPVSVRYNFPSRVSHFRPFRDFVRISLLNSILCSIALVYAHPRRFFSHKMWRVIKNEAIKPQESNLRKALSLGFGVFMGILPIWGFQLIIGFPLSAIFRLNKVLFLVAANISIPPMIPFIVYYSFVVGQYFTESAVNPSTLTDWSLETITSNTYQYFVGAVLLALLAFVITSLVSFGLFLLLRKRND